MAKTIRLKIWDDLRLYYSQNNIKNYSVRLGELLTLYTTILVRWPIELYGQNSVCHCENERECGLTRASGYLRAGIHNLFVL